MLNKFFSGVDSLNRNYFFDYFIVLLLALVLFSWLQASSVFPEPDSFYHAKLTQLISQGEILNQFPWLQATDLKDRFVDHHFLYHLLLVPFVKIFNPLLGLKIATVIFASLLVLSIYWLFKKFQIKWPFLFILILLVIHPWLFRVSLVKAPAVFLTLLMLAFYSLVHQKKAWLFLLSFASVWLYAGWPLLLVMGVLYLVVTAGITRLREKQSFYLRLKYFLGRKLGEPTQTLAAWTGLKVIIAGSLSGLIINPYFPSNLLFFWQQFIKIAVVNYQKIIGVGGEWYPYGFVRLIADAPLAGALLLTSFLVFILTYKKQSVYSWFWGILSLAFFLLTLKSRRYVEMYIPFTVIFGAFCWSDFVKNHNWSKLWSGLARIWQLILGLIIVSIFLGFIINVPQDLAIVKKDMNRGMALTHYQGAASWLRENTPKGSIIFHADWDDFPALFYYNDHNYYLTGLDPTFMYENNQEKYWQYVRITLGQEEGDLGRIIQQQFQADYVFLDQNHWALDSKLKSHLGFVLVYEDRQSKIYQYLKID